MFENCHMVEMRIRVGVLLVEMGVEVPKTAPDWSFDEEPNIYTHTDVTSVGRMGMSGEMSWKGLRSRTTSVLPLTRWERQSRHVTFYRVKHSTEYAESGEHW